MRFSHPPGHRQAVHPGNSWATPPRVGKPGRGRAGITHPVDKVTRRSPAAGRSAGISDSVLLAAAGQHGEQSSVGVMHMLRQQYAATLTEDGR